MSIPSPSFIAAQAQTSPPRYQRVPKELPFPTVGTPSEGFVVFFQVTIVRFYAQAFHCLPGEYRPGMFRWRCGRRASAFAVFPTVIRTDPLLAIRGLRQAARPPLSNFWENTEIIQRYTRSRVVPALLHYLWNVTLTSALAIDLALTIEAIESMQRDTPNYLVELRDAFDRALEAANMLHAQNTDQWAAIEPPHVERRGCSIHHLAALQEPTAS